MTKRIVSLLLFFLGAPQADASLTFDEALRAILARDVEISSQASLTEAMEVGGSYRRFYFLPSISLDGSRQWDNSRVRLTSATATARMNLFRFGGDLEALSSQQARERAARAKLAEVRLQREKFATRALLNYLRLTHENAVLVTLEEMEVESLRVAQRQFESGRIPIQESQKVKIDLENVRSRVAANSIELSDAKASLGALLGSLDVETEWPWKDRILRLTPPKNLRASDYFAVRPDWVSARSAVEAQDHLASEAFRSLFPTLDASLAYGTTRDHFYSDSFQHGWTGILSVSIPLFNRLEQYSNYRAQSATRGSTEALAEGTKRTIESEFATIPARYETAKRTALSREEILKISGKLYQDNLLRYRQGRASSNELNIDLNRYLETQLNAVEGWQSAHAALVDYYHLTGQSVLGSASLMRD